MKILRINQNRGQFSVDGTNWIDIDKLDKEALLKMVELIITTETEMDMYDEASIQNKAHNIIYKNLHDKLTLLTQNKSRFRDESESLFRDELRKYKPMVEDKE